MVDREGRIQDVATTAPTDPSVRERLSVSEKFWYGIPGFAASSMGIVILVYMPRFYVDEILAPLGLVAVAMAGARALDALTDPLIGWLSDRTRTPWGRRLPWIAVAVPLSAVSFFALFSPPESLDGAWVSIWFATAFGLYFLFQTMVDIPHKALGAELTLDYNDRSSLFGYKSLFLSAGAVVGSMLPWALQIGDVEPRDAYRTMGILCGLIIVLLYVPLVLKLRERPEFSKQKSNPLAPGIRRAFRNRPFRILLSSSILHAIPGAIPGIIWPFYTYYVIRPENPEFIVMLSFVCFLLPGFLMVPVWVRVAQRIGKRATFILTALMGVAAYPPFALLGPGDEVVFVILSAITGLSNGASFLTPAMLADTTDYDEFRNGKRREGQIYAFLVMIPKFVLIPSAAIPLAVLATVGYVPNAEQSAGVVTAIRLLTLVPPIVFWLPAAIVILWYPITERIHERIRAGIADHARGQGSPDPVEGEWVDPPLARVDEETGWRLDYFSRRELASLLGGGPRRVAHSVVLLLVLSLFLSMGSILLAIRSITDPSVEPGLLTVSWIVIGGFSLVLTIFHVSRLRPALGLLSSPVPPSVVELHIRTIEERTGSGVRSKQAVGDQRVAKPNER